MSEIQRKRMLAAPGRWNPDGVILGILLLASTAVWGVTGDWQVSVSPSYNNVVTHGGFTGYEAFPDIARLQDGRLMVVFYEGYGHVSLPNPTYPTGGRISYVTSSDDGVTWNAAHVLYDGPLDDRDPSITQMPDGTLFVTFFPYQQPGIPQHTPCLLRSDDGGVTWSEPQLLAPEAYAISSPVRRLSSGRLIAPLYYMDYYHGQHYAAASISDDDGATWGAPIVMPNNPATTGLGSETDVIELKDGTLWTAIRCTNDLFHYSTSADQGNTWSTIQPLDFRADAPYLHRTDYNDIILMAYRGYDALGIQFTALRYSDDECATWSGPIAIDSVNGAYPSMVDLNDGTVLVVYYQEGAGSDICSRVITIAPVPPNTPPCTDTMESYPLGGSLVGGSYNWYKGRNGPSPGGGGSSDTLEIRAGGIGSGARCAGGSTHSGRWLGSALNFKPLSRGVVDVNVLVYGGYMNRFVIYVQGDGLAGQGDGHIWLQIYPSAYDRTYSRLTGLGHDQTGEGDDIDGLGWVEVNIHMDFDNTTMLTRWRDVNDSTGGSPGTWRVMQSANVLPFHAFDYVELTGLTWSERQYFDNVTVTGTVPPDPVTCAEAIAAEYGLAGDVNKDCQANLQDLALLAQDWLRCIDPIDDSCEHPWERR